MTSARPRPGTSRATAIAANEGFGPDFVANAVMPDPDTLIPYGTPSTSWPRPGATPWP